MFYWRIPGDEMQVLSRGVQQGSREARARCEGCDTKRGGVELRLPADPCGGLHKSPRSLRALGARRLTGQRRRGARER